MSGLLIPERHGCDGDEAAGGQESSHGSAEGYSRHEPSFECRSRRAVRVSAPVVGAAGGDANFMVDYFVDETVLIGDLA